MTTTGSLCTESGCGAPAVVEKMGRSLCRRHADTFSGTEYPVREPSWESRPIDQEFRDLRLNDRYEDGKDRSDPWGENYEYSFERKPKKGRIG